MMFCDKCGKEIRDDALFCRYCGAKTEEEGSIKPLTEPREAPEKPKVPETRKAEKMDIAAVIIAIFLILDIGLIIAALISEAKYGNELVGEWVPISGFDVMDSMPEELNFEKDGEVTLYDSYDGVVNGEYEIENRWDILRVSGESINQDFSYKVTKGNILYLNRSDGKGFAAYINLAEATEEQKTEYYYAGEITDEDSLTDYLPGRWAEYNSNDEVLDSGGYFIYSENDDGARIRYNLPAPEHGDGFDFEDNVMVIGSDKQKSFLLIPTGYLQLSIYCYEGGNYYNLRRVY